MRRGMDKVKIKLLYSIMLVIMGACGILLAVSELCGGFLPDIAVRIIGIADIVCLPIFIILFVIERRK